ncbi:acetyltransferase [Frankia sp. R43]|uniref:phosphopantetheine-binding protein n=1 Tax=Frankia sp. R43 TaxID=269536 RepID=UPI0006CA4FBE|nr:phosphopantetheine-binding protein [Frankia sp. R43]KPM51068.1 acetyltransferase [Frankia sp. R43]
MLSTDVFEELVSRVAGVQRQDVRFEARLTDDLGLDSYGLLELCSALADVGVDVGEEDWLAAGTVGDLYTRCCAGGLPGAAEAGRLRTGVPHPSLPQAEALTGPGASGGSDRSAGSDGSDDEVLPPELAGRYFQLTPVLPSMAPFLYELSIAPDVGFRWRYRGAFPPYEKFEADLWQGMLAQFLIVSRETGEAAGHAICYNPDFGLGNAYVGVAMTGRYQRSGIAAEPVVLFLRYLFDVWPFRKLYFELPEFNCRQFASAIGSTLHIEARFRDHDYYRGRRWDRVVLAAYRQDLYPAGSAGRGEGIDLSSV